VTMAATALAEPVIQLLAPSDSIDDLAALLHREPSVAT
jgi:hypothetical protein